MTKISIRNHVVIAMFLLFSCVQSIAADSDFKQSAIEEFDRANYPKAIVLLKEALNEDADDPELYYYLGFFMHYLCYDSVPLSGYGIGTSDEILRYLEKAVELNPRYGNAYYFIGVEHGARARMHLATGDLESATTEFALAKQKGGLPGWLIEYGRNMLRTCEPDAILFTGGDADTNPLEYLQLVEEFRTDVTVMPLACLERPWFVLMIREGVEGIIDPAPVSWSREQILNMHPYKWKKNLVAVPVPPALQKELHGEEDFKWVLEPDLVKETKVLLSAGAAVLADIIRTNQWKRPLHFSVACNRASVHGLDDYFQLCGTTYKLIPVRTAGSISKIRAALIEEILMDVNSYTSLPTVVNEDMPKASHLLGNYRAALIQLSYHYYQNNNKARAREVLDFMEETIREEYVPVGSLAEHVTSLRKLLED